MRVYLAIAATLALVAVAAADPPACNECWGKTSGPCRHNLDYSCFAYMDGTTTCPPGSTECGPIDCQVTSWSAWGKCDEDCGGGFQTRTRTVTTIPSDGGALCPVLSETQACNEHKCPEDICQVSDWSAWGKCSATCGGGSQTRTRKVVSGFLHCPDLSETQDCNTHKCTDCAGCAAKTSGPCMHDNDNTCYSYFPGTTSCPAGTTACVVSKTNLGVLGGKPGNGMCTDCFGKSAGPCRHDKAPVCHDFIAGTTTCPAGTTQCTPINCEVSAWSKWGKCSANCGGGVQQRSRSVTVQPANGGMACPDLSETQACNEQPCLPVCENCVGKSSGPCQHDNDNSCFSYMKGTTSTCPPGTHECIVQDCVVSDWSAWGKCDAKCGGGNQFRSRSVVIPASKGGQSCPHLEENQACNTHNCASCAGCMGKSSGPCMSNVAPVCFDYYYGTSDCPSGTTECTVSKKDFGTLGTAPGSGMCANCFGKSSGPCRHNADSSCHDFVVGTKSCPVGTTLCAPIDCQVSAWSKWDKCSASCGGGSQSRTRSITVKPQNGGAACPDLSETQACNEQPCIPQCNECALGTYGPCQHDKDNTCFGYFPKDGLNVCPPGSHECVVVDCEVSAWSKWGKCSANCGGGSQSRSRTILVNPSPGGIQCPDLSESQDCNTHQCTDCVGCAGKSSGPCKNTANHVCYAYYKGTEDCPAGTTECKTKSMGTFGAFGDAAGMSGNGLCSGCFGKSSGPCRHVKDTSCFDYLAGTKTCPPGTTPCAPVNCEVSSWSAWSKCSVSCGGGNQQRTRSVTVEPSNGGMACPHLSEDQTCNTHKCPVLCDHCGGKSSGPCIHDKDGTCHQYNTGTTTCPAGTTECENVDCEVSQWSDWGKCSVTCGGGSRSRTRKILQAPSKFGQQCPGLAESEACNTHSCAGCAGCAGKSTGPCKQINNNVCYDYYAGTTTCPAGTTECKASGKTLGVLGGKPGNGMCTGCFGKSAGPCRHLKDTSCYNYMYGTKTCPPGTAPCAPIDCEVSAWSAWSKCSASCGGGSQSRSRSITVHPSNGGMQCPALSESQSCNTHKCAPACTSCYKKSSGPCRHDNDGSCHQFVAGTSTCPAGTTQCKDVDCVVSSWSAWSKCSAKCGGGLQSRSRSVVTPQAGNGAACPSLTESQACNEHACHDCAGCWGETSGPCQHDKDNTCMGYFAGTKVCPPGTTACAVKSNTLGLLGGKPGSGMCTDCFGKSAGPCRHLKDTSCFHFIAGTTTCPPGTAPCAPVNCEVSAWSKWSKCSASCDGGIRTRTRSVTVQPSNGGMACPDLSESEICNDHACPTTCHGCVGGTAGNCRHDKDGTCFAYFTKGGLSQCPAGTTECYPVDCVVSDWSAWSKCSASCGGGVETRTRSIKVAPKDGGAACPDLSESRDCNTHSCGGCAGCAAKTSGPCMHNKASVCYDYYAGTTDCPAGTTDCATTGNTLGVLGGKPGDGMCKGCFGKSSGPCQHDKDTSCYDFIAGTTDCPAGTHQCMPVNCEVSEWSAFSACSATCGGGTQTRKRTVTVEPQAGGMKCPPLEDTQACNTDPCPPICTACAGKSGGPCQHLKDTSCHAYVAGTTTCPAGTAECVHAIDCVVSDWSDWSACDAKCEGGSQTRTRTVVTPAANGGKACPALSESQACNTQPCQTCAGCAGKSTGPCKQINNNVCYDYYAGTKICPAGAVSCVNKNLNVGAIGVLGSKPGNGLCSGCFGKSAGPCRHLKDTSCFDYVAGTKTCPPGTAPCAPVDCQVSSWSAWAKCSVECGGGSQSRSRSVTVAPQNGGASCPHLKETQACNTDKCPVRCDECGGKSSGPCRHDKDGTCHQFQAGTTSCPAGTTVCQEVDCQVSEWGAWGKCDATCGGGMQQRTRTVTVEPTNGGTPCPALTDAQVCNTHNCNGCSGCLGKTSGPCKHDKVAVCYGYYHGTTTCPAGTTDCKASGTSLGVLGGKPGNGMCSGCAGKSSGPCMNTANNVCYNFVGKSSNCPAGTTPCSPANCVVSAWSAWSKCSATCGGGVQSRSRTIQSKPSNGGMACPDLTEQQACNTHKCGAPKSDAGKCGKCAGKSSGPCRHAASNVCHNYYYGTNICPSGTSACVLCDKCTGKSSGPCQHDKDGSCHAYQSGTTCPAGTHDCAKADNGNNNGGNNNNNGGSNAQCTGCWPGTAGPCQSASTVCYDYFPGSKTCPGGSYECAKVGSLSPKPLVVFDVVFEGSFDEQKFKDDVVTVAGVDSTAVVIESVEVSGNDHLVGFVVVTDNQQGTADAVTMALASGQVNDAGTFGGMNKNPELNTADEGTSTSSTILSTPVIVAAAVAVVALAVVTVGVVALRRRSLARQNSVTQINIPSGSVRVSQKVSSRVRNVHRNRASDSDDSDSDDDRHD